MSQPTRTFSIRRDAAAEYFRASVSWALLLGGVWIFGLGLLAGLLYWFWLGKSLSRRQAEALSYRLEDGRLCIEGGVYFLKRKTIPLDRITDFTLTQGPLLRRYGLWALYVQTAGVGVQGAPEATLVGIENPEQVRDELLRARDLAAARSRVS
jgi:membrane protein YdbS with pleckstrin-like domain